jgi:hypothetical protein
MGVHSFAFRQADGRNVAAALDEWPDLNYLVFAKPKTRGFAHDPIRRARTSSPRTQRSLDHRSSLDTPPPKRDHLYTNDRPKGTVRLIVELHLVSRLNL